MQRIQIADGDVHTDRTSLVRAMPAILDGLQRKGLQPVRLDVLLRRPGYRRDCAAAGDRTSTRQAAAGMTAASMAASVSRVRDR